MARRLIVGAFLLAALLGCEPTDKSTPSSIPDGSRTISKGMRGIWNAPGGPNCRWWIVSKSGKSISNPGNTTGPVNRRRQKPGKAADQSQTVVIGSGNVGETFKSDRCAPQGWTR